jgi:hypothetical protein
MAFISSSSGALNTSRYAMTFNGTPSLLCTHFLLRVNYFNLGASRKVKSGEILFAVLAFLKLSVCFLTPFARLSRFPALNALCYTDNEKWSNWWLQKATYSSTRPTLLGGQQASSRELGHQNAINLGHSNLLCPAIFACQTATMVYSTFFQ